MKKFLLPALALTGALFLYNCTGDDAALLTTENTALDSLAPGDSTFIDSVFTDTVSVPGYPGDSIYFPGDSAVTDTVYTPVYPYPYPGNDSVVTDSLQ